eukprot:Cvel_26749.t1-p1 / transcript=Cvel_26749.t1 / gene=Cvel_26749 / organism=Chromera_velia_CCMP2878 / gene_product=hypothetical protein / transcript_product=hypothetical protein / location=Cvel_scaffold3231:1-4671(-) / protein_length=180 / sequence_SO=supercontig / SO=protein_coding / is_pseudo=false
MKKRNALLARTFLFLALFGNHPLVTAFESEAFQNSGGGAGESRIAAAAPKCFDVGVRITGDQLSSSSTGTPVECQDACRSDGSCKFFSHEPGSGSCTFHSARTTTTAEEDVLTGPEECLLTYCAVNEYVSSNVCTACAPGTTNAAGDDATGGDTTCDVTYCAVDEYVSSNVCTACAPGTT